MKLTNPKDWLASLSTGLLSAMGPPVESIDDPDGDGVVLFYREGYKSLHMEGPERRVRGHVFGDLESLAAHLNRHALPEVADVLVSADKAVADFMPHTLNDDIVSCPMVVHPCARRWLEAMRSWLTQRDFLLLVLSAAEDFASEAEAKALAGELQMLKVVSGGEMKTELDQHGRTKFSGAHRSKKYEGEIPQRIVLQVPLFVGICREAEGEWVEATYPLELFIHVLDEEKGFKFKLSCPGFEVVQHQAVREAAEWLRHLLNDGFLVGLGSHNTGAVPAAVLS